jgi:LPS export ABC transporter protein LptC/lipopolysaccharide transport protein LptA
MSSQWLNVVVVLAALMIGYGVFSRSDNDNIDNGLQQASLLSYTLKDAIITETDEAGHSRVRFAASEVAQDLHDSSVTLTSVRADYLLGDAKKKNGNSALTNQGDHWVLNADQARIPAKADQSADRIELRGNVNAYSVDAPHSASLNTQSLDVDMEQRMAHTDDTVRVDIDGHAVNGRGLFVDMEKNHIQLKSDVTMQLAAIKPNPAKSKPSEALSIPDLFEADRFDYSNNDLVLTKVRTKSEPFISANQARASGTDLANNQVVLSGAVRLELPKRGLVTADAATLTVQNNRIVHAQLTGAPVNFQHQRQGTDELIRGRGTTIDYDLPTQIVRFLGEAWFSKGKYEFTSDAIEYNLITEAAQGGQSRIVVTPHKDESPTTIPAPEPESPPSR